MDSQLLQEIGLSTIESAVLLDLYENGDSKAGQVIARSRLYRNSVYLALESLEKKNLVTRLLVRRVAVFHAGNPERLVEMVDAKRRSAELAVEGLRGIQERASRDIRICEGMESILLAREKSLALPAGETIYLLGGSKFGSTPEMETYWRKFHAKRVAKGIKFKILYDHTAPREFMEWRQGLAETEVRVLPFEVESPSWFEVYGETVGIGIPGDEPFMIIFKSPTMVASIKKYFEYFWKISEKL